MADRTGIEWTDATWNPIRGCTRVSEGCRNCYAERIAARFSGPGQPYEGIARMTPSGPRWTSTIQLLEDKLDEPLRWRKPRMVFVNSMSDLFHEDVPDEFIDRVFAVMALSPNHIFQVLTKRPERMVEYLIHCEERVREVVAFDSSKIGGHRSSEAIAAMGGAWEDSEYQDGRVINPGYFDVQFNWPLPNVWLGVSAEDQATADQRIPHLLQTPAAVRFLSCEPLLGPIDFRQRCPNPDECEGECGWPSPYDLLGDNDGDGTAFIDWVIVGGESGPGARPMHPDWVRSIRDQCEAAGVPFFFKQWGEWLPNAQEYGCYQPSANYERTHVLLDDVAMARVGKKAAGAMLDGREWREFPSVVVPVHTR